MYHSRHSPNYNCIKFYNKFPTNLKTVASYDTFKKRAKGMLVSGCYYSTEKYLCASLD